MKQNPNSTIVILATILATCVLIYLTVFLSNKGRIDMDPRIEEILESEDLEETEFLVGELQKDPCAVELLHAALDSLPSSDAKRRQMVVSVLGSVDPEAYRRYILECCDQSGSDHVAIDLSYPNDVALAKLSVSELKQLRSRIISSFGVGEDSIGCRYVVTIEYFLENSKTYKSWYGLQ